MNILHLDTSALGEQSASRALSARIVAQLQAANPAATIEYRDLDAQPVAHLTHAVLSGKDAAAAADGEAIMAQFQASDVVVIGTPMYNFGVPSTLKAWIDRIAVAGKTFRYTETGPKGLVEGKRVIVASTRGSIHPEDGSTDFQEAWLRQLFAFIGVTDVQIVRAQGLGLSPQHRTDAMSAADTAIRALTALPRAA